MKKRYFYFLLFTAAMLLACNLGAPQAQDEPNMIHTQAAATVQASLLETQMAATQFAGSNPTATFWIPTATTFIPTATQTQPPPTPTSAPCDWARFVGDVTIADGTTFAPGTHFKKTWRLQNIGVCTWTTDYDLVFVDGNGMDAFASVSLPKAVFPGELVDVSVDFTAPDSKGNYRGYWMLRNANGLRFGLGANADSPFWVDIKVIEPNSDYAYDFAFYACTATWSSAVKDVLPCPGSSDSTKGFIDLLDNPVLEHKHENEPTLLTHPDNHVGGWIQGVFPAFKVKDGDHFKATVGCMDESKGCKVIFRLQYQIGNGSIETLGEWYEVYDGTATEINIDLSALDGEKVKFILSVVVDAGKPVNANAFWFVPRIIR
jgi:hypothetical protein